MSGFRRLLATTKLRLGRGLNYFTEIKNAIYITAGFKIIFPGIDLFSLVCIGLLAMFIFWLMGWFDEKKFKIWQEEASYSTRELNPHLQKIDKLMKKISSAEPYNRR